VPALPAIASERLGEVASELRFGSKQALRRAVERAEQLAAEIDPGRAYPDDWIVFRLTGYRPERSEVVTVDGAELLGDLSALTEGLCERAGIWIDEAPGALTVEELCDRWNVSRKTVERYRRRGLIARRVDVGGGRRRLVFTDASVAAFERRLGGAIERAGRFDRMPGAVAERVRRWAGRYRSMLGWDDAQIAARLAVRPGRSERAVRAAIAGDGASRPRSVSAREEMVAWRAARRGIEPARVAERTARTVRGVQRGIERARLRTLRLALVRSGRGEGFGAGDVDAARGIDLPWAIAETDLRRFIETGRLRTPADPARERALGEAQRALVGSARAALLGDADVQAVDRAQADLRLASRVSAVLVRSSLAVAIESAESALGGSLERMTGRACLGEVRAMLAAAAGACGSFDPSHGGRLAGRVALAVGRAVRPERAGGDTVGRASAVLGSVLMLEDWTRSVDPWQRWTEPDARIAGVLDEIEAAHAAALRWRFGLDDGSGRVELPRTLDELAVLLGTNRPWAAVAVRRAVRAALDAARARSAD